MMNVGDITRSETHGRSKRFWLPKDFEESMDFFLSTSEEAI
jgi:hypothetical protein